MDTISSATISNAPPESPASDFDFLRQEGIRYIQQLAGQSWTDHNMHDPGITILDQLCYAITDLSYRIDFDIRDLLAAKNADPYRDLFSPAQILTVNPVTLSDIRKVVIDVEGVKNAWVEKITEPKPAIYFDAKDHALHLSGDDGPAETLPVKGLYHILIELNELSNSQAKIVADVKARLNQCRNLCEDFYAISALDIQPVTISGMIEVGPVTDINRFAANILFRIASFISPQIRFYTLEEWVQKGKPTDEIFDGPALDHGFIDDDELRAYDRKTELHISDIIREIMDEPGVVAVSSITAVGGASENWRLVFEHNKVPKLEYLKTLERLVFIRNGVTIKVDNAQVNEILDKMKNAVAYPVLNRKDRDRITPGGVVRNLQDYHSIQHHFPAVYGLGDTGLPALAPPQRVAKVRQLKAYLMIFEQILANQFAQVEQIKKLFSFESDSLYTYFHQSLLNNVPDADKVVKAGAYDDNMALATANMETGFERKHRFLDHLLARFNESFVDYSLLSGFAKNADTRAEDLANDKMNFLRHYPAVSNNRGKAFNYTLDSWDTGNVSGLEKRIAAKIGIRHFIRQSLAGKDVEGFHLIEHILLRPRKEDFLRIDPETKMMILSQPVIRFSPSEKDNKRTRCFAPVQGLTAGEQVVIINSPNYSGKYPVTDKHTAEAPQWFEFDREFKGEESGARWVSETRLQEADSGFLNLSTEDQLKDPYSLQLTFVFPGSAGRFANQNMRDYVENVVREETPVHLTVYISWLQNAEMEAFEAAYKNFLYQLSVMSNDENDDVAYLNSINCTPGFLESFIRKQNQALRSARDILMDLLPVRLGTTFPMSDIMVCAESSIVSYGEPGYIKIYFAPADTDYEFYDAGTNEKITGTGSRNGNEYTFKTPPLTKDHYTFTVYATKKTPGIRKRLLQKVYFKIGINTNLDVLLKEQGLPGIEYGKPATIIVMNAQGGYSYQVCDINNHPLSEKKEKKEGNDIEFITPPLYEDTEIRIRVSNPDTSQEDTLTRQLTIKVYPDTAIQPVLKDDITDYNAGTLITLDKSQESAHYQLAIAAIDDDTITPESIGKGILIGSPVPGTGGALEMPVPALQEDTVFKIMVTKPATGLLKELDKTVSVIVRPDTGKALSILKEDIPPDNSAVIKVNHTQRGILYQLRAVTGNKNVNIGMPAYHHKNYGIGKARIEIEFAIDPFTDNAVYLPTGVLEKTTTFNVLAIKATNKAIPGAEAVLTDTITVEITR